jgi:predicted metal-dependent peptidase
METKKEHTTKKRTALENFRKGWVMVEEHPIFRRMIACLGSDRGDGNLCPNDGWAVITSEGVLHSNATRIAPPEEWSYVIAHALLHLAFDHFRPHADSFAWTRACDIQVAKFLYDLKIGKPPDYAAGPIEVIGGTEQEVYERLCETSPQDSYQYFGTATRRVPDFMTVKPAQYFGYRRYLNSAAKRDWSRLFARGLRDSVRSAINVAGGLEPSLGSSDKLMSAAQRAHSWFINSYPLLGALAAAFKLVESAEVCSREDIGIAAVDPELREIYINKTVDFTEEECRFVMAHEFLHVALRHQQRRHGRDPYLWNVACDYVINAWLIEMGIGNVPGIGLLFDDELKGLSAEAVYERITVDLRRCRKLATLRGHSSKGDMIDSDECRDSGTTTDLDEFYRRCLAQGFVWHQASGRGYLPAGLIEEIEALSQPPVPWDVELARWFDNYFPPLEKTRTYARISRRQSSTPDIPRPNYAPADPGSARTFGVVLDTSGSMSRKVLAKALGAIASYSISRDVPLVRVVFCDAIAYDQGYISPEAIAERVQVQGRGGTKLQPGIDCLERAIDFPDNGPLLIITDGQCERLRIRREHAFLLKWGCSLPFNPPGNVFHIDD